MNNQVIEIIEKDIIEKLRLDKSELMWMRIDSGTQFLDDYLSPEDPLLEKLKKSAAFWNWWRAVWANRDKYLLKHTSEPRKLGYLYLQPVQDMTDEGWMHGRMISWAKSLDFYRSFHSLNTKSGHMRPPAEVIELTKQIA